LHGTGDSATVLYPVMDRISQFKVLSTAAGVAVLAATGFSQSTVNVHPAPAAAQSPVLAPQTSERVDAAPATPAPAKRTRAISPEVAAALAAAGPKYEPPAPKPPPKPESELVDLREIDKPKNEILRLPEFVVRERKPPVFRERDIYTDKGITDIAMRRYISDADRALNRFTLPLFGTSKEARARAMYAEDERLKNMTDIRDAAIDAARVDPGAGDYIRREAQKTFLRSADFGWSSGDPR